jgi:GST-like protein
MHHRRHDAYPWCINCKVQGQDIADFPYCKRWFEEISNRPAVQCGMAVGSDLSTDVTKLPPEEQARISKVLYNQRALPISPR